jgi:hypothetical protein
LNRLDDSGVDSPEVVSCREDAGLHTFTEKCHHCV